MKGALGKIAHTAALFFFASQTAAIAGGYFLTGNELLDMCKSSRLQASGYMMGFAEGYAIRDEMGAKPVVCLPNSVMSGQVIDVVCRYLEQNPETRHWSAAYQAHNALVKAWPCK